MYKIQSLSILHSLRKQRYYILQDILNTPTASTNIIKYQEKSINFSFFILLREEVFESSLFSIILCCKWLRLLGEIHIKKNISRISCIYHSHCFPLFPLLSDVLKHIPNLYLSFFIQCASLMNDAE